MTRIYIKDYSILYEILLKNKFKYNTTVLRRLKEEIYELVISNEPTTKMKVVGIEDDDNLDNVEVVVGVGVISEFGKKGYCGLKVEEIFEDVLFDNGDYDANFVVTESLPILLKHNTGSVPIYKYISNATVDLPLYVTRSIKTTYEDLLSRSIRNNRKRKDYINKTINYIISTNESNKSLELIPFLQEENIDTELLGSFLRDFYKNNTNIFIDGKNFDKINFRRLIKIYDWLKYYKAKES